MTHPHRVKPEHLSTKTVQRLWVAFILLLSLSVLLQFFVHPHPHFGMDGEFWFYPVYGFAASVGLVLCSRLLGFIVKRRDDYWERKR